MIDHPIVDSHVHLCDPATFNYSWMNEVPALNHKVLPEDLDKAAAPFEIDRFVFVEVDVDFPQHIREAEWVAEIASSEKRLQGVVASLPVEQGNEIAADLDRLTELGRLRGIRRLIQAEPDPDFCLQPKFLDGLRLLGARDVPFEICILHHQMSAAIEMVKRCDNVKFVLDHIGKPNIKNGLRDPWRAQIKELARMENVVCKISGVVTEADHDTWSRQEVQPYIEHAIECFGFDRSMYGGDFHVMTLATTYPEWVETVDWIVASASEDERQALFRETAIAHYRLNDAS